MGVFRQFFPFSAQIVREEHETALIQPFEKDRAREGTPAWLAVANVIAFGSLIPESSAS